MPIGSDNPIDVRMRGTGRKNQRVSGAQPATTGAFRMGDPESSRLLGNRLVSFQDYQSCIVCKRPDRSIAAMNKLCSREHLRPCHCRDREVLSVLRLLF